MELPPFYCITNPDEPWREDEARAHFANAGIAPEFIRAFNGASLCLHPTNPYQLSDTGHGLFIHTLQVAEVLSYLLALQIATHSNKSEFVICQDDIQFIEGFQEAYLEFRKLLPPSAHVAQLEYVGEENKPFRKINDRVRNIYYPFRAGCIWWTREGALAALQSLNPIDRPIDQMLILKVFPKLNHVVAFPKLAVERPNNTQ